MRRWLAAGTVLALVLGTTGCAERTPPATSPNLLLITVDTLRADRLACYGGPEGVGERLCALFRDGTRYRWAFSTAPYTAPSVASLLSSRYPAYHGVTQSALSFLDEKVTTVAELLAGAGYTTAAFVSNPVLDRGRNLGQGFSVYDQKMTRRERNRPGYAEREAESTTDAVLGWAEVALREPWFLWVHYQDPHGPYEPPEPLPRKDPSGARRLPVLEIQSGKSGIPAYQALPGIFSPEAYERRYLDEIDYLEPHLERLVRGLDALGRPAEILLTADHGEAFGEDDYFFAHGHSLGLDQIRVPLFHRPADGGGSSVVETVVSGVDVAPTLLALAGLDVPPDYQGRPLPTGRDPSDTTRPIFAEHGRRAAAIRGERFYSRDRQADEGRRLELGQEMPWFPARGATLGGDGPLPAYSELEADAVEPLEAQLSAFLHETRDLRGVRHKEVSNETLERMRALGYVEE